MKKGKNPFYLVHQKGYDYCLERKEIVSLKGTTPVEGDLISFIFKGKRYEEGKIIMISDKEDSVLESMRRRLKERRHLRRSSSQSFDLSQPRKASLKQRKSGKVSLAIQHSTDSKLRKTSQKVLLKDKRDLAEQKMEEELTRSSLNVLSEDSAQADSDEGSSDSSTKGRSDSFENTKHDLACLQGISSSSSSEGANCSGDEDSQDGEVRKEDRKNNEQGGKEKDSLHEGGKEKDSLHEGGKEKDSLHEGGKEKDSLQEGGKEKDSLQEGGKEKVSPGKETSAKLQFTVLKGTDKGVEPAEDSSDSETEPLSTPSTSSEEDKKLKRRRMKRKKVHSRIRRSSTSSSDDDMLGSHGRDKSFYYPTPSNSDSYSTDVCHSRREKKSKMVKRNFDVYPGANYLCKESDEGVVKVHEKYNVFVKKDHLDTILSGARSPMQFIRCIIDKVYTLESLRGSTASGFPARGKGTKHLRKTVVLPRLHPDGRTAIIARAQQLEDERKTWRPRVGSNTLSQAFSSRVGDF